MHHRGRGLSQCIVICALREGDYQYALLYAAFWTGIISIYYHMHPPGRGLSVCIIICALREEDYQYVPSYTPSWKGIMRIYATFPILSTYVPHTLSVSLSLSLSLYLSTYVYISLYIYIYIYILRALDVLKCAPPVGGGHPPPIPVGLRPPCWGGIRPAQTPSFQVGLRPPKYENSQFYKRDSLYKMLHSRRRPTENGGVWGGGCPPQQGGRRPTGNGGFGGADAPPTGGTHLSNIQCT